MSLQEVYHRILDLARHFAEEAKISDSKQKTEIYEARSTELYFAAGLLENTELINPK